MTQGHSSGTPEQTTQSPTHLSHENPTPPPTKRGGGEQYSEEPTSTEPTSKQGARERHRRPTSCLKEPHRAEGQLFSHMPPRTSMANITAHALPSGDGEKMRVDDPTNDPRPLFRHTRTSNLITNPPFTRKSNPSPHKQAKREEKNNIEKSRHPRSQRAT